MKTQAHRKILTVAAAVMLGLATTGGAALARNGGFSSGHMGAGSAAGRIWVTRLQGRRRSSIPPVDTLCRRHPRHRSRRQVLDQYSTNRRVR
jgi:hypothetical protein